jgi:hypothetical protein
MVGRHRPFVSYSLRSRCATTVYSIVHHLYLQGVVEDEMATLAS